MKNDKQKPEEAEEPRTQTEKAAKGEEPEAAPKSKYVFKILPVDPKNSFDFEDVADK